MRMTVELFDNIINTSQDCVFWKDKERRFLGVNQAFLDFYGFESADVLIGKTDEDMGWHSDPEPYRQDELRVLAGESTYKVQGKCIIRGEERDIIASKRPLYENDKIVGLVGSFVDITDVLRRRNKSDGSQVMYGISELRRYPFFDRILEDVPLEEMLDPLTGILSRNYSLKFVHSLIAAGTPFSFSIIDLDNFKYINDTFGHSSGDVVLMKVAESLALYASEMGLAGRFGGDELLLILPGERDFGTNTEYYDAMLESREVLRKNIRLEDGEVMITGTIGCASYPSDADNFTDLFELIDKMLYVGKRRGRNCANVYDEKNDRDIKIQKLAQRDIYTDMRVIKECIEQYDHFGDGLRAAVPLFNEMMQIHDLYYIGQDGRMTAFLDDRFDEDAHDVGNVMSEAIFTDNNIESLRESSPALYNALEKHGLGSVMIARADIMNRTEGYVVCAVKRGHRIWQANEQALLYYFACLEAVSRLRSLQ